MTIVFVTGTGTGVGKTYVSAQIVAAARARALRVWAAKPVLSGYDPMTRQESDAGRLLAALGEAVTEERVAAVAPWRFREPLSPDMAARRAGRSIPFGGLVEYSAAPLGQGYDLLLVEGIGGVMAPLDAQHTVLDWIAALRPTVLLVCGSYLGTLSHTLTAARALAERGCTPGAVVVSESLEQPVALAETAEVLERFLSPVPVLTVPRGATHRNAGAFDELLDRFALRQPS